MLELGIRCGLLPSLKFVHTWCLCCDLFCNIVRCIFRYMDGYEDGLFVYLYIFMVN